jgi:hypothetical protein
MSIVNDVCQVKKVNFRQHLSSESEISSYLPVGYCVFERVCSCLHPRNHVRTHLFVFKLEFSICICSVVIEIGWEPEFHILWISYFVRSNKLAWYRFYFRFHFNTCILLSTFKLKSFIVLIILQFGFFETILRGQRTCNHLSNPTESIRRCPPFVDCKKVSGLGDWKAIVKLRGGPNKQVSVDFYILLW